MTDTKTQEQAILAHLESGLAITPLEALAKYGCFRLGARIWELKQRGWDIQSCMVKTATGKRIAKYWLLTEAERAARAVMA